MNEMHRVLYVVLLIAAVLVLFLDVFVWRP